MTFKLDRRIKKPQQESRFLRRIAPLFHCTKTPHCEWLVDGSDLLCNIQASHTLDKPEYGSHLAGS